MSSIIAWTSTALLAWPALWSVYHGIRGLRARPEGLRERARADLADWDEQLYEADPGHAEFLRRPAVLSRYLDAALDRPGPPRREVRRRAWKTLRCLRCWWGAFELNRLAWDCIAWSFLGAGNAGEAGEGAGRRRRR